MSLKYKRIMLKLSGESLMGDQKFGISSDMLTYYAEQIKELVAVKAQVAIVIGGGNIFRGLNAESSGIERVTGDYMGMLATCINGMALQSALESNGVYTRLISAIEMRQIAEPYVRRRATRHLEKGRVLIFSAGTGSPYFTTDSAAALRANEINADVILKGTRVDGIYDSDPEKNPNAVKFVLNRNLLEGDPIEFKFGSEAKNSPLVQELFNFPFVLNVFVSTNFITVTKTQNIDWTEIIPQLRNFISEYFNSGKELFSKAIITNKDSNEEDVTEEQ